VQAVFFAVQLSTRDMNNGIRQFEFLFGGGIFRFQGRLTGLRRARRIVRIRTNDPAARMRLDRRLPKSRLVHGK
jgi:hypothetical protein